MREIFDPIVAEVTKHISGLPLHYLEGNLVLTNIKSKYSIKLLDLDTQNTKSIIGANKFNLNNAPIGLPVGLTGTVYNYVQMIVPVKGDYHLLDKIFPFGFLDGNFYISGNSIVYKEYTTHTIAGNEEIINGINRNAKARFDGAKHYMANFNIEAEKFNEKLLMDAGTMIELRKKDLNTKQESERKLNPFL